MVQNVRRKTQSKILPICPKFCATNSLGVIKGHSSNVFKNEDMNFSKLLHLNRLSRTMSIRPTFRALLLRQSKSSFEGWLLEPESWSRNWPLVYPLFDLLWILRLQITTLWKAILETIIDKTRHTDRPM